MSFFRIFKYINRNINIGGKALILIAASALIYIPDYKLLFLNSFYVRHEHYTNINVKIYESHIIIKPNNESFEEICRVDKCGFGRVGEYVLKEIRFITIFNKRFLQEGCFEHDNICFYNIDQVFIDKFKSDLFDKLKEDIKTGLIFLIIVISASISETRSIRRKRILEKKQERKNCKG